MLSVCDKVTWLSIVGARPQFIKLSPVSREIIKRNQTGRAPYIEHRIIHTGQHYDPQMNDLILEQLAIPSPHCNLGIGSGLHGEQLSRMLSCLEPVLLSEKPDWVIVYGDTNSSLAGALTGARLGLRLAHVEAGCRSYNAGMPEEQNRVLTDHLSHLLLAPCRQAVENLRREGIGGEHDPLSRRVQFVGDVMHDALLANRPRAEALAPDLLQRLELQANEYYLLTLHRAENTAQATQVHELLKILQELDRPVLFPVHPRTSRVLSQAASFAVGGNIRMVAPLGYLEMLAATRYARKLITDSGGLQKEALYLHVPCITLRQETEWPETIAAGANRLVRLDRDEILGALQEGSGSFDPAGFPFGQGNAASLIVDELLLPSSQLHEEIALTA